MDWSKIVTPKTNPLYAGLTLAILVMIVWNLPHAMHGYGKLVPQRQAILQKSANGQVSFTSIDYLTGKHEDVSFVQIERGEMIRLRLMTSLQDQQPICKNDTLALINSSETEERMTELCGRLSVARALLDVSRTGEKSEIITAYRHRLEQARAKSAERERNLQRQSELFQQKLASEQLYETAQSEYRMARAEMELAEAELAAARTGAKPEQIRYLQSQIASLENQISLLNERKNKYTLLAPFAGRLSTFINSDTLAVISDSTHYVLLLPVKMADVDAIQPGISVHCDFRDALAKLDGTVHHIKRDIFYLNGEPMVTAVAISKPYVPSLQMGSILRYSIPATSGSASLLSVRKFSPGGIF